MLDAGSPVFNIGEYVEILGPVDPVLFETALRRIVAENDALHLRVLDGDGRDCSPGTVASRLHRGRAMLKTKLSCHKCLK